MFKNVGSQKIRVFAFDVTTGLPKTGDAANITAYVNKDWGGATVLGDTSATEIDATNAKGCYLFDLTQAESNADALDFTGKSTTANISIVPQLIYTLPASFTSFVTPTNLTAAQIATGVWQDATAGDFTAANSIGKSVMNGVALGTGLTINALSSAERTAIADAMFDETNGIETGVTMRGLMRLMGAVLGGKLSGAGSGTETFRNTVADSKNRIVATVDSSGNRTAITADMT